MNIGRVRHLTVVVAAIMIGAALLPGQMPASIDPAGVPVAQAASLDDAGIARDVGIVLGSGAALEVRGSTVGIELAASDQRVMQLLPDGSSGNALGISGPARFAQTCEKTVAVREQVPYVIQYIPDQSAARGQVVVWKPGTGGVRERTFHLLYVNGILVARVLVSDCLLEPPAGDALAAGKSAYRGGATSEFYMEATAYSPTVQETDADPWITASGMRSGRGVVAVDPRVIPLGSKLYVEGYGYAIAGDTGGSIRGDRIDVFFYSSSEMVQWGRRWVRVFVLP